MSEEKEEGQKKTQELKQESQELQNATPKDKKKIIFWSLLASGIGVIVIAVVLPLVFLLPKEEKYEIDLGANVSVSEGALTGTGSYKKGDSVTIVAEEIEGYRFTGWTLNGQEISDKNEYTFTIDETTEGEYTANYAKIYTIDTFSQFEYGLFIVAPTEAISGESITVEYQINSENQDKHSLKRLYYIKAGQGEQITIENNTFIMPEGNVTVYAEFNNLFNINLTTNIEEEITLEGQGTYLEKDTVTIKAPQVEGYRFRNWTYNGNPVTTEQEYIITSIDSSTSGTYIANYDKLYSISVNSSNGIVTITDNKTNAIAGENVEFTVTPNPDYRLIDVKLNGQVLQAQDGKYTFIMPNENATINVTYAELFDISVTSEHGQVEITENKTQAIAGENVEFTVTPNPDYRLLSVKVNDEILTAQDGKYTFVMPNENATINVTYAELFDISVTSEHGQVEITDSKTQAIENEDITFTITPSENYRLDEISINNGSVEYTQKDNTYSFTMPAGDVVIAVSYNQEYAITIDTNSNEYIQIDKEKAIEGEEISIIVEEREGYRIDKVKYNETTLSSENNTYTFNMPKENVTISVTYIQQFEVDLESNIQLANEGELSGGGVYDINREVELIIPLNTIDNDGNPYRLLGLRHNDNEELIEIEEDGTYTLTLTAETAGTYTAVYEMGYTITVDENSSEYIQIDKLVGFENDTITFAATVEDEVTDTQVIERALKITKADGQEVEFANQDTQYSFIMPAGEVVISIAEKTQTIIKDYSFAGGSVLEYTGNNSEVTFPTSYYPYEIESDNEIEITYQDIQALDGNSTLDSFTKIYLLFMPHFSYRYNGMDESEPDIEVNSDYSILWPEWAIKNIPENQFPLTVKLPTEYTVSADIVASDIGGFAVAALFASIALSNNYILSFNIQIDDSEPILIEQSSLDLIEEFMNTPFNNLSCSKVTISNIRYGKTIACVGEGIDIKSIGCIIDGDIPSNLFIDRALVEKIIVPEGMTKIGERAFQDCINLKELILPSTLTKIGYHAIYNCNNLLYNEDENEGIYLGNESNPYLVLVDSSSRDLVINDNCKMIYGVNNISIMVSVTIPNNVQYITQSAFSNCDSLTDIYYKGTVDQWLDINFDSGWTPYNTNLNLYFNDELAEEITINKDIPEYAFCYFDSLTKVTIGEGVTSIGNNAFYGCSNLTDIYYKGTVDQWLDINFDSSWTPYNTNLNLYFNDELADEITINKDIPEYAFYYFDSLTKVTIGEGVTSIGEYAFSGCSSLTDIYYEGTLDQWLDINFDSGWTPYNTNLNLYFNDELAEEITINKDIPDYAFYYFDSLTKVTIGEGVTSIGNWAFDGCSNLTDIYYEGTVDQWLDINFDSYWVSSNLNLNLYFNGELADEITINKDISDYAFYYFDSLTKVTLGEGVASIGEYAFYGCSSLTSITLPSNLTSIGNWAFDGCSNLTDIYYEGTVDQWLDINFDSYWVSSNLNLNLYFNGELADEITINKDIPDYAFSGIDSLTKVTLGEGVTSIGEYAFYGCSSLTSITLPSNLTSIGRYAFSSCSNLTEITLPSSLIEIGSGAFESCNKLTTVVIESDDIYKAANGTGYDQAGRLLLYATTVKVLKTIDDGSNTYLSSTNGFSVDKESDEKYNIYTK